MDKNSKMRINILNCFNLFDFSITIKNYSILKWHGKISTYIKIYLQHMHKCKI